MKKLSTLKVGAKFMVKAVDARRVAMMEANEKKRTAALDKVVQNAEKAANSGGEIERLIGIAKAVGATDDVKIFTALKTIIDLAGHKPAGTYEFTNDLGGTLAFNLIRSHGFTKSDMQRVAWGLPLAELEHMGIDRSSSGSREKKENN